MQTKPTIFLQLVKRFFQNTEAKQVKLLLYV